MGDLFASGGTSAYPTSLDTFTSQADATPALTLDTTTAHSSKVNNLAQAVINLETYVGTRLTAGSIPFGTSTNLAQNNTNLFWDNTNLRLGIGTTTPARKFHVVDTASDIQFRVGDGSRDVTLEGQSVAGVKNWGGVQNIGGGASRVWISETSHLAIISNTASVGIGTANPITSALLDLTSTTGALVVPRMTTTQRDVLTAADGMIIYNTTTGALNYRKAGVWTAI